MKKNYLLFLIALSILTIHSKAQVASILNNTGTSVNIVFGTSNYHASENIYTDAEIGANFTTAATAINFIEYKVGTVGTGTAFGSVKVYMKEVGTTSSFTAGTYSYTGYTQVFGGASGGTVTMSPTGWIGIPLSTSFTRTAGQNLQILIERFDNSTHASYVFVSANGNNTSSTLNTSRRANQTTPISAGTTSLAVSAFRAAIRFRHAQNNDAAIEMIQTLGQIPLTYSGAISIPVLVRNFGMNNLTNVPVSLSITGANAFSPANIIIPSLPSGGSTIVTFAGYNPGVIGNSSISASVPSDDLNTNNTFALTQRVNATQWNYPYVQANITQAWGVGPTAGIDVAAAKFTTASAANISKVKVRLFNAGITCRIRIYAASGGLPTASSGAPLWESPDFTSIAGINEIAVSPVLNVPAGDFFVSVKQMSASTLFVYGDIEEPLRTGTFFRTTAAGGAWTEWNSVSNCVRFDITPVIQLATNAGLSNLTLPNVSCHTANQNISIRLNNDGANTINSGTASVALKIGGAGSYSSSQSNSTNISAGSFETITFTGLNFTNPGVYNDTLIVSYTGDIDQSNDTIISSHTTATTISNFPAEENAEGPLPVFGYASAVTGTSAWFIQTGNYTNADQTQPLAPHGGTKTFRFDSYNAPSGTVTRLFSNCLSIPSAGCNYKLTFWMSHDNTTILSGLDSLYVSVSTDKGLTWVRQPVIGIGSGLQRHDASLTANVSPIWRKDSVDLSSFAGQTIQIGFEGVSKFGNSFSLDDITVLSTAASNVNLLTAVSTQTLTEDCTDNGWTYYKDGSANNMLAIAWGTNTASKATASASITLDASDFSSTSGSGASAMGTFTMKRYWNVSVGTPLSTPVDVRFFYSASEKAAVDAAASAFQAANSGSTLETGIWFKTNPGPFVPNATNVTSDGVQNAIALTNANSGSTINGVLYAQFNGVTSFSGGTYAAGVGTNTPVPVKIEYFRGTKQGNNHVLDWKVTCINTQYAKMTVEVSKDSRNFSGIYNITETALRCQQPFSFNNTNPFAGINYYRLRMEDDHGVVTYSSIVALINGIKGFEILNITPNPVTDGRFKLNITSAEQKKMEVYVTDVTGRVVLKQTENIISGFNAIDMNVSKLAGGTYQIYGVTDEGMTRVLQFVKQ